MTQSVLPGSVAAIPARMGVRPIVRWVGGKAHMVSTIAATAHTYLQRTRGRYAEPFLGGGAVALDLGLPGALLADRCGPLMDTYRTISRHPVEVHAAYTQLVRRGWSEETYYTVRDIGALITLSEEAAAARFLYLNAAGFNGVYRENRKGRFNVPWGLRGRSPKIQTIDALRDFARATRDSDLSCEDFAVVVRRLERGDFVFADPPYLRTHAQYVATGFALEDHERLATELRAAHDRGVFVCATNSDEEEVRAMYSWADVMPTTERRSVSRDGGKRQKAACLLIASDASQMQIAFDDAKSA